MLIASKHPERGLRSAWHLHLLSGLLNVWLCRKHTLTFQLPCMYTH